MSKAVHTDRCVDPFKLTGRSNHRGKDLRTISRKMLKRFPGISKKSKICHDCRAKSYSLSETSNIFEDQEENMDVDTDNHLEVMNSSLQEKIPDCHIVETPTKREIELEEFFSELKTKYSSLQGNDPLKLKILTIAPESWSLSKISKEFGCSRRLAKNSRELRAERGIFPETVAKVCSNISPDTKDKVSQIYNSDEYSRMMPGRKNSIPIIINGKRSYVQKRLVLLNLKELYAEFKKLNPKDKVGFSTFAKMRPKNCILAGSSGTHSVCVCTIHENCKLMLDAIDIKDLTKNTDAPLLDYKDCIKLMVCKNPRSSCYLDECRHCPGSQKISKVLLDLLEQASITHIEYSAWTGTDRSILKTKTAETAEFVEELCLALEKLIPHSFIAKEQTRFITEVKNQLQNGEVLVMFDFSENYKYVVQNASQAFHFNNDQCTVFPILYYYKENEEIKHKCLIFLSNSTKHDTAAVYTILNLLIPLIKKSVRKLKKLIYITDGAKQHFKNRFQISNLLHHEDDFGIKAEWHFTATAHGKSSYDGLGATFKREAYKASLKAKPKNAMLTPEALLKWAKGYFDNIEIFYFSQQEHEKMTRRLNRRFKIALPVTQILKNHSFTIIANEQVLMKRYSNTPDGVKVKLQKE